MGETPAWKVVNLCSRNHNLFKHRSYLVFMVDPETPEEPGKTPSEEGKAAVEEKAKDLEGKE